MADEQILLFLADPQLIQTIERTALLPAGFQVSLATDRNALEAILQGPLPDVILLSEQVPDGEDAADGLEVAAALSMRFPQIPLILLPNQHSDLLAIRALRLGFADYLPAPVQPEGVIDAVRRALQRRQRWQEWGKRQANLDTKSLEQRLTGLEALQRVSRQVTSLLDLDSVLRTVVDAAVELTGAEEGSLLLLDENTGDLYMRAGRNFQEEFVRTFRLPIRDTLAGQVLKTGKPVFLNEETPQKIKTSYLVYTLIYVPLVIKDRVIGVLEVGNRHSGRPFNDYHQALVSALADYAAIAVENASLYSRSELERSKVETIIKNIEDGVIVVDTDGRLIIVNQVARAAFNLDDPYLIGKPAREVLQHQDLLDVLNDEGCASCRLEIGLDDGRVFNAQVTPIPEVGLAVMMQDITYLKELDRIKSDFVATVSHDLRSPLTAILGYVELLERVGPINEQQREFIHRVQLSVQSITALINDLLDLGRIEAGFDSRKEFVPLNPILQHALDSFANRARDRQQQLLVDVQEGLPQVLGNPVRLRQLLTNLVGNALKYTQPGGQVRVSAKAEAGQIILQIADNGPGIPAADQPYIFDKFYRASNVPGETPGTGLGLAIVKSIVENHQGRIWVESTPGQGSTFTVVLPVTDHQL